MLQLGVFGIAGAALYKIRIAENIILMSVISVFAAIEFNCYKCADANLRNLEYNERIMLWIVIGWTSVTVHTIMSFIVGKLIDDEYEYDIAEVGIGVFGDDKLKDIRKKQMKQGKTDDAVSEKTVSSNGEAGHPSVELVAGSAIQ